MSNLVVDRYKGNEHFVQTWRDIASVGDAQGRVVAVIVPIVAYPKVKAVEMAELIGAAASGDAARFPQQFTLTQPVPNKDNSVLYIIVDKTGTNYFTLSSVKSLSYLSALFDKLNGR